MMKFKAAGADVWDPKWDAHPIGGGAKKMLTREELFERANPVDDPRPLLTMKDILDDLLELRKKSRKTVAWEGSHNRPLQHQGSYLRRGCGEASNAVWPLGKW
ncbi:unnamed protein product [Brassica rapa subsp. trilocularis]